MNKVGIGIMYKSFCRCVSISLGYIFRSRTVEVILETYVWLYKNLVNAFPRWLCKCTSPVVMYSSRDSARSPAFNIVRILLKALKVNV